MMDLTLDSCIRDIYKGKRVPAFVDDLQTAGLLTINDILWILPNRIQPAPKIKPFNDMIVGELFHGAGVIQAVQTRPVFGAKGKGRARLSNVTVVVRDFQSDTIMRLKWFNSYYTLVKKLKSLKEIIFLGQVQAGPQGLQIFNPNYSTPEEHREIAGQDDFLIQYPTINKISGTKFKLMIDRIPHLFWDHLKDLIAYDRPQNRELMPLHEAFCYVHGKIKNPVKNWQKEKYHAARTALAYEEYFSEQVKIFLRKSRIKNVAAPLIKVSDHQIDEFRQIFPYELTADQKQVIEEIRKDLKLGMPMMRLVQGDVGCGKTTVAVLAALIAIKNKFQVAFMCPTESLAQQHLNNLVAMSLDLKIEILLGSTKAAEKRRIYTAAENGDIDILIGTHSLIQKDLAFKKLGLAIIDEQHKFGVNQRIQLCKKGNGTHCLIMTATPIPRSLSLTQYGDLDLSYIKTIPAGRKGIKTKIIEPHNMEKFLTFVNTRIEMGEQVYVVTPTIEESEKLELLALEKVYASFCKYFPHKKVHYLHGKMKAKEKHEVFNSFSHKNVDILIATSVVEVGIDVPNATVIAIFNPERFGLSSLHQLRGRVGRGGKPGFCFLVMDGKVSEQAKARVSVIEKTTDGFIIAEEDLRLRGEGDLFGTNQSGIIIQKKVAKLSEHSAQLDWAKEDVEQFSQKNPEILEPWIKRIKQDDKIFATI